MLETLDGFSDGPQLHQSRREVASVHRPRSGSSYSSRRVRRRPPGAQHSAIGKGGTEGAIGSRAPGSLRNMRASLRRLLFSIKVQRRPSIAPTGIDAATANRLSVMLNSRARNARLRNRTTVRILIGGISRGSNSSSQPPSDRSPGSRALTPRPPGALVPS